MGSEPQLNGRHLRFGVFELDTTTGEVRKHGVRVRLQDQPLKFLLCLLETPGEVCTRDHLIRRIWPEGTFVDYDRGLNSAATRLRQVLGDTADAPRYVETVDRKGYRFIAPVEHILHPKGSLVSATIEAGRPLLQQNPAPNEQVSDNHRKSWHLWPYLAVLGVGLTAGVGLGWWRAHQPGLKPLVRLNVDLDPEMTATGSLALAPDGARLAVVVRSQDGKIRLATRRLDQDHFMLLPGTEGASSPFFSPDGQWIAFFADNKLKKIGVQGGMPVALGDAPTIMRGPRLRLPAGSWGENGDIIAMLNPSSGLTRVASAGAPPTPLTKPKGADNEVDTWPQVLPGSRAVLFTRHKGDYDSANLEVLSLKTGEYKTVLNGGFFGRYLPGGYLVYMRRNTLFAVSFDLSTFAVVGTPQAILEDINSRLADWSFDFSQNGSFAYINHAAEPQRSLFWIDKAGRILPLPAGPEASVASPRFSPDGSRLAFSKSIGEQQDICVLDLKRGAVSRLTAPPGVNDMPVWTPDSLNIIFRSVDQPKPGIYAVRADGSAEAHRLLELTSGEGPSSVSPDGKWLAMWAVGKIWIAPVQTVGRDVSVGKPVLFLQARFNPTVPGRMAPAFSPDGRWLAYCENESGQLEVYVVAFPGPGGKWRVSTAGGMFPVWSHNGQELFFQDLESHRMMVARYKTQGDSFVAETPRL